jgi:hypothetical protein
MRSIHSSACPHCYGELRLEAVQPIESEEDETAILDQQTPMMSIHSSACPHCYGELRLEAVQPSEEDETAIEQAIEEEEEPAGNKGKGGKDNDKGRGKCKGGKDKDKGKTGKSPMQPSGPPPGKGQVRLPQPLPVGLVVAEVVVEEAEVVVENDETELAPVAPRPKVVAPRPKVLAQAKKRQNSGSAAASSNWEWG